LFTNTTTLRIHYALTDQMGVVYYGNYAQFYEIGRTEAIRSLGFTYKALEAIGIIMPVVETSSKFLRPAKYDDVITIQTSIKELPNLHSIIFYTEIFNEAGKLLNTGSTTLVFVDTATHKKINIPKILFDKLEPFFNL
jgi:acyl-CoA thioester hydrolase